MQRHKRPRFTKCRGTKDQIDQLILREWKRRNTDLGMAWVNYLKGYDTIPHSWIIECLEMFRIAENVKEFLKVSMENWRTDLTRCGESLGSVNTRRRIF